MIDTTNESGITLIELSISIVVFAVLILALGQTVLVGQQAANEARRQANILLACQQVLEQVQQKTVAQMIAEDGSTFSVRVAGPEGVLESGGLISVDKDLNGDGALQTGSLFREDRGDNDLVRVRISFSDETIIEKVVAQRDN